MNAKVVLWSSVSLAALAALAFAQSAPARKLARVGQEPGAEAPQPDARQDFEGWKKRLSDGDLDRREGAFSELLAHARGDESLRDTLEKWSRSDATDLAWTSRLALRELRRAPAPQFDDLRQRFEALERDLGGMDSMFEDLRLRLVPVPQLPGAARQLQVYSLKVGPDGVTLETTEEVDGNTQKRSYKAKDMEELLQQNPELRGTFGNGFGGNGFGGPGLNAFGGLGRPWPATPRVGKQPPTNVLGIYSEKLSPEQARDLGLEPEQGLRVDRIEPGTIAQVLGIRRGDTLVELNGKPIYSAEDVRKVLQARAPEEDLAVTLIDEGSKERRTLRWSPGER